MRSSICPWSDPCSWPVIHVPSFSRKLNPVAWAVLETWKHEVFLKDLDPPRNFFWSSSKEKIPWNSVKHPCSPGQWTHIYPTLGDSIPKPAVNLLTGCIWRGGKKRRDDPGWLSELGDLSLSPGSLCSLRSRYWSKTHEVESQSPLPWFWSYESCFPFTFSKYETKTIHWGWSKEMP